MRLFVAIEAPEAWRQAAAEMQRALAAALDPAARAALRVVDPSLMHLTLRFIGETEPTLLDPLREALRDAAPPVDLQLALGRAGTFGPPQRTSVVWAGIEGDVDALATLAGGVERAVQAAGLPADRRAFSPHLTLARTRRQAQHVDRAAIAAAVASLPLPAVDTAVWVHEVVLVRSHLGAPQPRYEVLGRWS